MIYVSSDWHGVPLLKIKELLSMANFSKEDYLFVLGDVIDRGENGIELLRWLMHQPNAELILGNHEAMMLSCDFLFDEIDEYSLSSLSERKLSMLRTWQSNGADPTLSALTRLNASLREGLLDYLREAPLYDAVSVNGRDYLLVHAGLGNYQGQKKLEEYSPEELLWQRPSPSTRYSEDFVTIVGHTPTVYYGSEYKGRLLKTDTWWNIDTGAACGGYPMLLCLDNMKEFYINKLN